MATRQLIVDDFDGAQPALTYQFGLEGVDYEIDLTDSNLEALRAALAPFIAAGRRSKPAKHGRGRRLATPARGTSTRAESAAIRGWWAEHWQQLGLPQPTTQLGPIPRDVRAAYDNSHSAAEPAAEQHLRD